MTAALRLDQMLETSSDVFTTGTVSSTTTSATLFGEAGNFFFTIGEVLPPEVLIAGERFRVESDHDLVYLSHSQWSLIGVGPNFRAAYVNLLDEANAIASELQNDADATLSKQARSLKAYAQLLR